MKNIYIILSIFCILFSCDDIVEVEDISEDVVSILAPTDNAVLSVSSIVFTWESLEDADSYRLQIATPNFENATQIVSDTLLTSTSFNKTLEAGDYQWRIRAENSGYETNYVINSFSVED